MLQRTINKPTLVNCQLRLAFKFLPPNVRKIERIIEIGPMQSCLQYFIKNAKIFCIIIVLAALLIPSDASAKRHHHKPHHKAKLTVDSEATYADIVIDAETGLVLHATNPERLRHPASLTKMMTLYLTFQALDSGRLHLNQYLPISVNAAEQPPSKLGLRPGQRIRVEDAILGLVTESANDDAVVLAEWMGGSENGFGQMMTRQAHALGMKNSRFENPSGLPDPDQITTARDMAVLGHALIYHFPQYYPYFSHDSFTYAGIYHHNHNHLMERYDGMDGIKTGYIRASGFNLVASAKRGQTRLIGVVFGGHSTLARDNRMAQLLDQSFALMEREKAFRNVEITTTNDAQGDSDDSPGGSGQYIALPAKVAAIFPSKDDTVKTDIARDGEPKGNVIPDGNWGIQIGAYSDPEVGRQALAEVANGMPQILGSGDPQIQKVMAGQAIMYRARLMSLDQKNAQAACLYLTQHAQTCLTVGP
jgi:D-alanyl-D-alanine carboxypeptidase